MLDSESRHASGRAVEALSDDGISSTCLIKECLELEESLGVEITKGMLGRQRSWGRCQKEVLRKIDWEQLLRCCRAKAPVVAMVQERVGWLRLWDSVMDYGVQHTRGLQMLSRLMSHHGRGQHPCPLCEASDLTSTVLEHVLSAHRAGSGDQQ